MKKLLLVLAAAAILGLAGPASAQVYADPGGVGVQVGPFGAGVGPDWRYRHHGYRSYAYSDDCRVIRERTVTPSGRVIIRTRQICD